MYNFFVKRFLDIFFSLIASVVLSPIFLVVAVLVRCKLGSPVLFKQQRPGKDEKIFILYKFRSMTDKCDKNGRLLSDADRLTKFGRLLRSTSLDELPELFSILKGDMSFVGPRPQLVRDLVFMTEEQRKRHSVRPGLSGLAQVSGRNNMTWEKKFQYDLQYIQKITMWEDMKIIVKTVFKVFERDGITEEGMATAEDLGDYLLHSGVVSYETYENKQKQAMELVNV